MEKLSLFCEKNKYKKTIKSMIFYKKAHFIKSLCEKNRKSFFDTAIDLG